LQLVRQLDEEVAILRSQTLATSTANTYASQLRQYFKFCEQTQTEPVPASRLHVARYIAFLARRLRYSSIIQYLNVIRILHLEAGCANPLQNDYFLKTVLKGARRQLGDNVSRKLPMSPQLLLRLRKILDVTKGEDKVFWAVCCIGLFSLLRMANLLPESGASFDPVKQLCRSDCVIIQGSVVLVVRHTKTIQCGERHLLIPLPVLHPSPLCPVRALIDCLACFPCSANVSSPFLLHGKTGLVPMTKRRFTDRLNALLRTLGVSAGLYSGHSFRRGGATWALQCGVAPEVVRLLGDWRSDCYKDYISANLTLRTEAAQKMGAPLR